MAPSEAGFVVDVSQAVINRTAMYRITMDTLTVLGDRVSSFQAFGDRYPTSIDLSELKPHAAKLFDMIGRFGQGERNQPPSRREPGPPVLYLDPLYVLMGGLEARDTVLVLDMSATTNPEWHSPAVGVAYRAAFDRIQTVRPRVLCISANTKESFRANYGYPDDLMTVVPLYVPAHLEGASERLFPVRPFVLFVGSLETRKNLRGALRSFALSNLARRGFDLLVAGGQGHGASEIEQMAATTEGARLLGFVSDAELQALYGAATVFLYPSFLEGFGVPLLEAMHAGVPAVASTTGACPEVGGSLVKYVDPDDHEAISTALVELVDWTEEQRLHYRRQCRAWIAERFTLQKYSEVLSFALRGGGQS